MDGSVLETPVEYDLDSHTLYNAEGSNTVSTNLGVISSYKFMDKTEAGTQATLNIKHMNQYLGI